MYTYDAGHSDHQIYLTNTKWEPVLPYFNTCKSYPLYGKRLLWMLDGRGLLLHMYQPECTASFQLSSQ